MHSRYNLLSVSLHTSLTVIFLWVESKGIAANSRNTELNKWSYLNGTKAAETFRFTE